MHKILKLTVAAACMLTAYQAQATKGLSIKYTTHGSKETFYADSQGNISGITSTVRLENTGDEALNPGDEGYSLTLCKFSYSLPYLDVVTYQIPEALEPGATVELDVTWPSFPLTSIIAEGHENDNSWRDRYDIREDITGTVKTATPWLEFMPYKPSFSIVPENSGQPLTSPINFGFVESATTQNFRIRNTGGADLTITSITLPEGFSATPAAPFTMAGLAAAEPQVYMPLAITFNPTVSGAYSGNLSVTAEGVEEPVTIPVSGAMIGENDFFEGFELPSGASESTYIPTGWIFGEKWKVSYQNTSSTDTHVLDHTSADDEYYTMAISPRLDFGDGGALMFQACKKSYYSELKVMISTDRANWTQVAYITPNGTEDGAQKFPTQNKTLGDYTVTIPAGEWYIGFKAKYSSINNIFGGKIVAVDHDVYPVSREYPEKMIVNNAGTFTATFRNISANTEAEGSYTVELFSGDKVVATAEAPEWESGTEKTFTANYTPHAAGEETFSFRITLGNTVVGSESATITVSPETSSNEVTVGESRYNKNYVPANMTFENATSQMILPQSYLAKYGITPGAKITGLSFTGNAAKSYDCHKNMKFWIINEPEQTKITVDDARDLSAVTPNYSNENEPFTLVKSEDFTKEIQFAEPFVYDGGNLFMSWETLEVENGMWGNVDWQSSGELAENAIYKYNDDPDRYLKASWSTSSDFPVIKFSVFKEAATISGTVTGAGAPVADTEVVAKSGEVIYSAVTDSEGHYSMEIFQPELSYTVTVDNPSFPVYTSEVSLAEGSQVLDIALAEFSQEREYNLTINVTDNAGCNYEGVPVKLVSDRFSLEYDASETKLDANGSLTVSVYGGAHTATVAVPGMKTATVSFSLNKDYTLDIALEEDVNAPYALELFVDHDIVSGRNDLLLTWNGEEYVFFDNFENYPAFTIDPQPWTGIDGDLLAPANLEGEYDSKGLPNHGQIINPSAVKPAWNLDNFYTLKPRSGKQYLGFITPADNGKTLNDWMITPEVELTADNVVRFFAKGSDRVPAKFTVGITEAENPTADDFTIISDGNAIECPFADWTRVEIPLADYAGKKVKIGIRCISGSGSFISMIDDFFIGRPSAADSAIRTKARRVKSAANPNERFEIYLDGEKYGETTGYEFTIPAIAEGRHSVGVKAVYVSEQSEMVETTVNIDNSVYAKADITVATNNGELPESTEVTLTATGSEYTLRVPAEGLTLAALPKGSYSVKATAPHYDEFTAEASVEGESTIAVNLTETLVKPFNITAETEQEGNLFNVTLRWNQDLGFTDSFEDYDDFATGTFGQWTTLDFNTQNSYPIAFGSQTNIVTFPGASTPTAPAVVPPMVFNPFATTPSMEGDYAIYAPEGVKTVAFFGPQQAVADKWLISPALAIGDGYQLKFLAKAYAIYPEVLQIMVSTTGTAREDFTLLDEVAPEASGWTEYSLPLDAYAGQTVNIGIRCVSNDGFLVQVDGFEVAPVESDQVVPTGKVLGYDVALNGTLHGTTQATSYTLAGIGEGKHHLTVTANYTSGASAPGEYDLELIDTAIDGITSGADMAMGLEGAILVGTAAEKTVEVFTTSGVLVDSAVVSGSHTFSVEPGVYIVRAGTSTFKVAAR